MRKFVFLVILVSFFSGCQFQKKNELLSGTYESYGDTNCLLKIIFENEESVEFEVFCNQINPPYNSGTLMGTVNIFENRADFEATDINDLCLLHFEFVNSKVRISQSGSDIDCGFGFGVYAAGEYNLINSEVPILGCMRPDNPCKLTTFK